MALTGTTLSGAISATELTIPVTSATGFSVGNPIKIETEMIGAILAVDGTNIKVRGRGWDGTAGVPHNALALVVTGLPSDFAAPAPGRMVALDPDGLEIREYSVNGAITIPDRDQLIVLNKAGVAAMTLANPTKAQDGLTLTIQSATANAHTVTYTAGFYGDTTSSDVATFAAKAGASMTIRALNGQWGVVALGNVTIA